MATRPGVVNVDLQEMRDYVREVAGGERAQSKFLRECVRMHQMLSATGKWDGTTASLVRLLCEREEAAA